MNLLLKYSPRVVQRKHWSWDWIYPYYLVAVTAQDAQGLKLACWHYLITLPCPKLDAQYLLHVLPDKAHPAIAALLTCVCVCVCSSADTRQCQLQKTLHLQHKRWQLASRQPQPVCAVVTYANLIVYLSSWRRDISIAVWLYVFFSLSVLEGWGS